MYKCICIHFYNKQFHAQKIHKHAQILITFAIHTYMCKPRVQTHTHAHTCIHTHTRHVTLIAVSEMAAEWLQAAVADLSSLDQRLRLRGSGGDLLRRYSTPALATR